MYLILFIITSVLSMLLGSFINYQVFKSCQTAKLHELNKAIEKQNHYAERWLEESRKAFDSGVEARAEASNYRKLIAELKLGKGL